MGHDTGHTPGVTQLVEAQCQSSDGAMPHIVPSMLGFYLCPRQLEQCSSDPFGVRPKFFNDSEFELGSPLQNPPVALPAGEGHCPLLACVVDLQGDG